MKKEDVTDDISLYFGQVLAILVQNYPMAIGQIAQAMTHSLAWYISVNAKNPQVTLEQISESLKVFDWRGAKADHAKAMGGVNLEGGKVIHMGGSQIKPP